jgi:hypothetical protein
MELKPGVIAGLEYQPKLSITIVAALTLCGTRASVLFLL